MPPPDSATPNPFAMANASATRALLEGAGFTSVRTAEVQVRFAFRDVAEYVGFAADTAGPAALVLRGLSGEEREAVKARIDTAFAGFAANDGYEFPGVALAAVAR